MRKSKTCALVTRPVLSLAGWPDDDVSLVHVCHLGLGLLEADVEEGLVGDDPLGVLLGLVGRLLVLVLPQHFVLQLLVVVVVLGRLPLVVLVDQRRRLADGVDLESLRLDQVWSPSRFEVAKF